MRNIEQRVSKSAELRVIGGGADGEPVRIVGHAAVFNELSESLGGFREKIAPGAFARALREKQDVRALFNHDENFILGRTAAKTLALEEDTTGLRYELTPPDTEQARSIIESIRRGDVSGNSFSFNTISDVWQMMDGETIRTLIDVDLFDVGPVVWPAYPQTDVALALRSLEQWRSQRREPSIDILRRRLDLAAVS